MRIAVIVHFIRYIYTEEAFIKIQMGINCSGGQSYAEIVNASCDKCIHVQSVYVCVFTTFIYIYIQYTATHMLQYT